MTTSRERTRVKALRALGLLDQPRQERFRRIVDRAQHQLDVPVAYLNLVDETRLWVVACTGSTDPELDRDTSFCHFVVVDAAPVLVGDASTDPRFCDNPLVVGPPSLRAYAGYPLRWDGQVVGTLCAFDVVPRTWSRADLEVLADLSAWAELELGAEEVQRRLAAGELAQRLTDSVLRSAGDGICATDGEGRLALVNPAACDLLAAPAEQLLGQPLHELLHPQDSSCNDGGCALGAALRDEQVLVGVDDAFRRQDGEVFLVQLSFAPLRQDDRTAGAVLVFQDVSQRREVERLKDEFVSVVSHELRTPLTSMRGSLGLLAAGVVAELPPEAQSLVDVALTNTNRLSRLVADILDLERLSAGQMHVVRRPHRLSDLVALALAAVEGVAAQAGVRLEQETSDDVCWGDADRLAQVLVNLLGNAIHFSHSGSAVCVTARMQEGEIRFEVCDKGRGIPPDRLEQVFERFAQVDVSDAREKQGSGLGLAICQSIVHAHGGRIDVDSVLGQGSTFTVVLPQRRPRNGPWPGPLRREEEE